MAEDTTVTDARPTTRARNRRGEGARLRDEIVAAAVALIDETADENAVTLRSVARRVGIAAPSIYRHFPDQPAIMLAVMQLAFAELQEQLDGALETAGDDPRRRLFAVCTAYLEYARTHPERYRIMFGGFWMPTLDGSSVTERDLAELGSTTMAMLIEILDSCIAAGHATSTDPQADAITLWVAMHGFAHQRAVTRAFPWPADMVDRLITGLAHLTDG